ncbi:hypothetical protein GJ496_010484 [Pomphorhynchus laevis]|nr:hypothetical protein GJ496_010484 [Pomphorhynchus laevis]
MRLKSSNAKPSIIAILCNIKPVVKYRLFAAYAIIDEVKNLTTSTEENDELTVAETESNLNANLELKGSINPFEPPLVVRDTIQIPDVHFLFKRCIYRDRVFSYAMNILFLSSGEKITHLVSNSNKFESSAVFTVNVSRDYTMFCTMNLFKSNATLIVNAQNTFLEISKSVFKSYTMLIVNAKTSTIYIYKSSFHSDVNIVGNISKLVLSYCYFANNSKLTISNPMVSL